MQRYFILVILEVFFWGGFNESLAMDIVSDGSLSTEVGRNGAELIITNGERQGDNLFHSFLKFDISEGQTALFTGETGLNNIFARVTGGDSSQISGTLQLDANIHSANFFLMNPAGIFFSGNATLDLAGSFYATTADYLALEQGERFYADPEQQSFGDGTILLTTDPAAFGFLITSTQNNSTRSGRRGGSGTNEPTEHGTIVIKASNLQANDAKSLILVTELESGSRGSRNENIRIDSGKIQLPNGKIVLAQTPDTFTITSETSIPSAIPGPSDPADFDINKDIYIRGGHLEIKNVNIGDASFDGKIGIDLEGDFELTNGKIKSIAPFTEKAPNAIDIAANNVTLLNNSEISTAISGELKSTGHINLATEGIVTIGGHKGDDSKISSFTSSTHNASQVTITADIFQLEGGKIQSTSSSEGNAGEITIAANTIRLSDHATINNQANGSGLGANITLKPHPDYSELSRIELTDNSTITSATTDSSQAGDINIKAHEVSVSDATITNESTGSGDAGQIYFNIASLQLDNSTISSEAENTNGGNIRIKSDQPIKLVTLNNSAITTKVRGEKQTQSGDIHIDSELIVLQNSRIIAEAAEGTGGNINIKAQGLFIDPSSRISASSERGIDGTVEIDAVVEVIDGVVGLPETYRSNLALRQQICSNRINGGQTSSLTVLQKPGMPIGPENLLSGDFSIQPDVDIDSPRVKVNQDGESPRITGCYQRKRSVRE